MAAIAYITDSKLLELHRANNNSSINFWRISTKTSFSNFNVGDLVFFLSKDKTHKYKDEKGIVGFGRLKEIFVLSPKQMWNKFGKENGYTNIFDFIESIKKVSKGHKLPSKISSLYLTNVTFFNPIYLSECNELISKNVESYIYLNNLVPLKLLDLASKNQDMWSSLYGNNEVIDEEVLRYKLNLIHSDNSDIKVNDTLYKKANRVLTKYIKENNEYIFIPGSKNEIYKVNKNSLEVIYYLDKGIDYRLLLGQSYLYKNEIKDISFKTIDSKNNIKDLELKLW